MFESFNRANYQYWLGWGTFAFLFFATFVIVIWQNSRVGVLWDLSYILENARRISLGDVPYRDFPFPYAPLTFLVQALIIKTTGAVFWHHILYCAVIGGLGTVLTWQILSNIFRDSLPLAKTTAFLLALPLIVLGNYSIYPHPFYDCDCTFYILLCIFLWQERARRNFQRWQIFLTGILFTVPMFVKQNTGLAFLSSVIVLLFASLIIEIWQRRFSSVQRSNCIALLGGAAVGLTTAFALIHFTVGLGNYYHWTVTFAAERRAPAPAEMLAVYADPTLGLWLALFALGAFILWFTQASKWLLTCVSSCLMSAPFIWSVGYLFLDLDASERAERLVAAYPFVLIVSFVTTSFLAIKHRSGVLLILPFVLIVTIHGVFMSQQLWGSTYAIWPFLVILSASIIIAIFELSKNSLLASTSLAAVISTCLIIAGGFYLLSNERLDYANASEGTLIRSELPQLKGLSVRGSWLTDFEELVEYTNREIPTEDGILMLPGEDLFYFTTGRRPRFPVLMFDHTINPYSPEEILAEARARNINWLIIKNDLQLDENPFEEQKHLEELLRQDFKHFESLNNYEIFRRKTAADSNEEDKDNDSEEDTDSADD